MMGETTLVLKGGSTIYLKYFFKEAKFGSVIDKTEKEESERLLDSDSWSEESSH